MWRGRREWKEGKGEETGGFGRDSGPGFPAPVTHPGMKRGAFGALSGDVLYSNWGRKMEGPQLPFPCACPLAWVELQSYPNTLCVCLLGAGCFLDFAFLPAFPALSASSGQSFEHQSRGERGGGRAGGAFPGSLSLGSPRPQGPEFPAQCPATGMWSA